MSGSQAGRRGLWRHLMGVVAVSAVLAGSTRAAPPEPAVVVQFCPLAACVESFRQMAQAALPAQARDAALQTLNRWLQENFGGLEGVDRHRPWGGYVLLQDPFAQSAVVVVVPLTEAGSFVKMVDRVGGGLQAVDASQQLFRLKDDGPFPHPVYLQIVGGRWAYFECNLGKPLPLKDLVAAEQLFDSKTPELAVVRLFPRRVPAGLVKEVLASVEGTAKNLENEAKIDPDAWLAATLFAPLSPWLRRNLETLHREATEVQLRLLWDKETGELGQEWVVVPDRGTALARTIATRPPNTQRFAAWHRHPQLVVAATLQPPQFAPEWREMVDKVLGSGLQAIQQSDWAAAVRPVLAELVQGCQESVRDGRWEMAAILVGPTPDPSYTAAAAVTCTRAAAVEQALHKLAADQRGQKLIECDVARAGEVALHRLNIWGLLPGETRDQLEKLLGDRPVVWVACGKEAVFLAVGAEAEKVLRQLLVEAASPAAGPVAALTIHPKRLHKAFEAVAGPPIEPADQLLRQLLIGEDDRPVSVWRVELHGGERLRLNLRHRPSLLGIPGLFLFRAGAD